MSIVAFATLACAKSGESKEEDAKTPSQSEQLSHRNAEETSNLKSTPLTTPNSSRMYRELPDENETFRKIRVNNRVYIDNTLFLETLLEKSGQLWLLTRPRRFGKSVFLMMAEYFLRGDKAMFANLSISSFGNSRFFKSQLSSLKPKKRRWPKWIEFPVIHLNFAVLKEFKTIEEFRAKLCSEYKRIANGYDVKEKCCRGLLWNT